MAAQALLRALRSVAHNAPDVPIAIYSDSKVSVDTYNFYAPNWERLGWRKPGGTRPSNGAIWRLIVSRKKRLPRVTVKWMKGRANSLGNRRADELTHLARSPFKSSS